MYYNLNSNPGLKIKEVVQNDGFRGGVNSHVGKLEFLTICQKD